MILNFLGYYALWWAIVCFEKTNMEAYILIIFLINLILHFVINVKNIKREFILIVTVLIIGPPLDLLFNYYNVLELKGHFYFWLPLIWITFATTINHSLGKIFNQKKMVLFLLGAIAGPFSYYAAGKFELLNYTSSPGFILLHALSWGYLLILLQFIRGKYSEVF
jgi:hypothetical protein